MIIYLPTPVFLTPVELIRTRQKNWGWTGPTVAGPRATITRGLNRPAASLYFVLHRMGFFLPRESLRER